MRRFLALVSAAALSASSLYWAGTGVASASHLADANLGAQAASTTTPSIWYVNPLFSYPLWLQSSNYFKQFAKADGYKATVVGNTEINEPQQITDINEAVAAGAQGIITCDLDPATFQKAIKAAEAKGVVVANVGCVDKVANYSVGTNNVQWGQESAQVIEKAVEARR